MLIHASSVALENKAVLIVGVPGSGKSDTALKLIMEHGAVLIADDQTVLTRCGQEGIRASSPASIEGVMEVRHVGLLTLPYTGNIEVALYVDLVDDTASLERLPERATISLLDYAVRRLSLPSFAASTPSKIRAALLYPHADDQ